MPKSAGFSLPLTRVNRTAENDADSLLAGAFEREAYPEIKTVLNELMKNYRVFIGSNTDNDVLESVMQKMVLQFIKYILLKT